MTALSACRWGDAHRPAKPGVDGSQLPQASATLKAIAIGALLAAGSPHSRAATDPNAVRGTEVHIYRTLSPVSLPLYVFKPQGWKPGDHRAALIWFFGGGWIVGTPRNAAAWANEAAGLGLVGVAPDYRVASRFGTTPLEAVADARKALRWVEEHAGELGIDPQRIVVGGNSAGGFLALWAAISHPPPGSASDESPPFKPVAVILTSPASDTTVEKFGGNAWALSPLQQLDGKMPPMLIFHGDSDKGVPYRNSVALCEKLTATGNVCDLIAIPGGSHNYAGDNPAWWTRTKAIAEDFLRAHGLIAK